MFDDPVEDIIKILYGPLEGKIYSFMKTKKKITLEDFRANFGNEYNDALDSLKSAEFIKQLERIAPQEPNEQKKPKGKNRITEFFYNDKFDFGFLFNKYKELKRAMEENIKKKENEIYQCLKCGENFNENLAVRNNYKCYKCNQELYRNDKEDLSDIKIKMKEIWEILDKRFKIKLENLNQEIYSDNYNYIKAKFGNEELKDISNKNKNPEFEKDNEPYVLNTLNGLNNSNEEEKLIFYELVEAFSKSKKK